MCELVMKAGNVPSLTACFSACLPLCACLFVGLGLSIQLWALKRRKCLVAKIDRGKDRMEGGGVY